MALEVLRRRLDTRNSPSVSRTRDSLARRPHGEPASAVRCPEPVFRVRRDEDHVTGTQLSDSIGSVQLDLALEDDECLGLTRVQVSGDALIRLGDHLAEAPAVTGLAGGYEVPQRRVSAGRHLAVVRTDDSHPVEFTHGRSVGFQDSQSAVTVTAAGANSG